MNRLELAPHERDGYTGGATGRRRFLDMVVDGGSLYREVRNLGYDTISTLWLSPPRRAGVREALIQQLMGEVPGEARDGRVCLYVCPECGDLGCGAITVAIASGEATIGWSEWRYENNYDPAITTELDLPSLEFDRESYAHTMSTAKAALEQAEDGEDHAE